MKGKNKNILLVNGVMKAYLEDNPSVKDKLCYKEQFEVRLKDDPEYKNKIVKFGKEEIFIKDIDENILHIVPAQLYDGVYYPLSEFNEEYTNRYLDVLSVFAEKVGINYEIKVFYELINETRSNYSSSANLSSFVGSGGMDASFVKEDKNKEVIEKMRYRKDNISKPIAKEELQKWLDEEKINLSILSKDYQEIIQNYLKTGDFFGEKGSKESIYKETSKNQKIAGELSLISKDIELPFKFDFNLKGENSNFNKCYSTLSVKLWK